MPAFGKKSLTILQRVHPDLVDVLTEAIKLVDFTVTYGHRTLEEQQALYAQGRTTPGKIVTKCDGVNNKSAHQGDPSLAVDLAPWPVDWSNRNRFYFLAGVIMGVASHMGVKIRWGGDFNRNGDLTDDDFVDIPHFELDE